MNVRNFGMAAILASLVFCSGLAQAEGDAEAGRGKTAMCEGCHGIEGFRTAYPEVYSVPLIGGQTAAYIVSALKAYRSGDRNNATMIAIATDLSDQDMDDLAAYYSGAAKQ